MRERVLIAAATLGILAVAVARPADPNPDVRPEPERPRKGRDWEQREHRRYRNR